MKRLAIFLLPITLACNENSPANVEVGPPPPSNTVAVGEPVHLVGGMPALVGVTRDDFAVFRNPRGLHAVRTVAGSEPILITDTTGSTFIAGSVVFTWANVDWTTNLGDMSVWTAKSGGHHVGTTLFVEGTAAASESGNHIVYATNVTETTIDLVIARSDLFAQTTLIPGVGRASETTCGPRYGFVGERLIIGYCMEGSQAATIQRYALDQAGTWQPTDIATDVRPAWTASADGERIAYVTNRSTVAWWEAGQAREIDDGIAWSMMLPDGSAVLYRVGDQLRRAGLPSTEPVPIVTVGFRMEADWSPDFSHVLYSTQVKYEGGTRRDLRLTNTQEYNPAPTNLVTEPVASIPRSSFTEDSLYTLYLTDVTPERRSTLNVRPVNGGGERSFANVDEVIAAYDSVIVFSADRTDPNVYPIKASLQVVDVDGGEPVMLEDTIMDGRAFALTASGDTVVYVRVDESTELQGLYVQSIR